VAALRDVSGRHCVQANDLEGEEMSDDSGEPITGEWLETIGFGRHVTPAKKVVYWSAGLLTLTPRGVEFAACPLPHIQTRGQMRDAVRVLLSSAETGRAKR
jgi:hypothetical protein